MVRMLLLLFAGGFILADGIAVGRWTDRWGANRELTEAAQRLQQVPMTIGDWNGTALELEPRAVAQAGFQGYLVRRYENQRSGAVVSLLVACGRPGPLCVHTPEVCYGGAGFKMSGARRNAMCPAPGTAPRFLSSGKQPLPRPMPQTLENYVSTGRGIARTPGSPPTTRAGSLQQRPCFTKCMSRRNASKARTKRRMKTALPSFTPWFPS